MLIPIVATAAPVDCSECGVSTTGSRGMVFTVFAL